MAEIIFADDTPQEMKDEVLRFASKWRPIKKTKLIEGCGINDADYMTRANTIYGQWTCPLYQKWTAMIRRVFSSKMHNQCPTYIATQLHPDWLSFMNFRNWCLCNGWRSDYQLDKDLISNLMIYGPNTCCFIPSIVNTFITECGSSRGEYPIGVTKHEGKFRSQCSNPKTKKSQHLGLFETPEEAHLAWKQKKHEHSLALADMYPDLDPRVLHELRTRYKS
ncbi:hypothetical protein G8O18_14140 [Enterobacter kobei]|uniref:hypothetical protein n=1 Tax=Enterobacter kobei TaxID=208224 RepID=UPI002F3269E3